MFEEKLFCVLFYFALLKGPNRNFKRRLNRFADRLVAKRIRIEHLRDIQQTQHIDDSSDESDCEIGPENEHVTTTDDFDTSVEDAEGDSEMSGVDDGVAGTDEESHVCESGADGDNNTDNGDSPDDEDNYSEDDSESDDGDEEVGAGEPALHAVHVGENVDPSSESNEEDDNEIPGGFVERDQMGEYLAWALRKWALEGGIMSMRKLDKLLAIVHPVYPVVPKSYKILLATPHEVNVTDVNGGTMWYKGIRANLAPLRMREYFEIHAGIKLNVNIDGLPLFKKSKWKFWPIQGKLVGTKNQPSIIGIYFGKEDPGNNDLLAEYAHEVRHLQDNGFTFAGVNYNFEVQNYICDAPARAKAKCVIEHGGYFACEKCKVEGEWICNRMTYCDLDAPLRTDESFINQDQPEHHTGVSMLQVSHWHPVSRLRLDPGPPSSCLSGGLQEAAYRLEEMEWSIQAPH